MIRIEARSVAVWGYDLMERIEKKTNVLGWVYDDFIGEGGATKSGDVDGIYSDVLSIGYESDFNQLS